MADAHLTVKLDKTLALTLAKAEAERDAVYRERAHLVALLAAIYPAELHENDDPDYEDWPIVYITLPTGQASWHLSPADTDLFGHVKFGTSAEWDDHTTEQKYERIRQHTAALAAAAGSADFFQAGKTYIEAKPFTAPEALTVFRCISIDRFPGNGEHAGKLLAFGFATPAYPGDRWSIYVCRQEAWAEGWNEYDETPALADRTPAFLITTDDTLSQADAEQLRADLQINPRPAEPFCLYQCPAHHGVNVHTIDCPVDSSRPVCASCSAEVKRQEIAADPYYGGDNHTMYGDDE